MKSSMRLIRVWLPVAAAFVLFASSATAYTVTLNGFGTSFLSTQASDGSGEIDLDNLTPAALPYSDSSISIDGANSAESFYIFDNTGFDITLDHSRSAGPFKVAESVGGIIFSVDENVNYVASGSYTVVDSVVGRRVLFNASIFDFTDSSELFKSDQLSVTTSNESFTLGESGGDISNVDTGSLTGTLLAGHDYIFSYQAFILSGATTSSATATGSFNLSFSQVIPEPSAALLFGSGFAVVGLASRRRSAS